MEFTDYNARFWTYSGLARLFTYGSVYEGGHAYPLLGAETPGRHQLVITAGFHGEEPAGPMTLLEHLDEVIDYARSRDVGLRVYPCVNPSGFEAGCRYNRSGEGPNNDFLRYEIRPGAWKGELLPGEPFMRWAIYEGGPKETRALRAELQKHARRPNAALDIHQDNYLGGQQTYAYVFGDQSAYSSIVEESSKHARVVKYGQVDEVNRTNELGLIEFNDGSVTDYFLRRGVPYSAALETTTRTSPTSCHRVNLNWIFGFIDLAARGQ